MRNVLIALLRSGCNVPTAVAIVDVLKKNLKRNMRRDEALAYLYAYRVVAEKGLLGEYGPVPNKDEIKYDFAFAQIAYFLKG